MNVFLGSYDYNIVEYNKYIDKCKKNKIIKKNNNKYIYDTINNIFIKDITCIIYDYYYIDYPILPAIPKTLSNNNIFFSYIKNSNNNICKIFNNWCSERINIIITILNMFNIKYIKKNNTNIIIYNKYMISCLNATNILCSIYCTKFYKIKNVNELINTIEKLYKLYGEKTI